MSTDVDAIALAFGVYRWAQDREMVLDTDPTNERFLVETGSDNTYLQNDLGLEVSISGALAMRVGYQVRHNTDVPAGIEKTDTLTTIGLIYETK